MTFKVTVIDLGSIPKTLSNLVRSEVQRLGQAIEQEVVSRTPVDTGRAKAGWKSRYGQNNFEISNQVPYIGVLDKGRHMTNRGMRGSKQAPRGIVGPSLDAIKRKN